MAEQFADEVRKIVPATVCDRGTDANILVKQNDQMQLNVCFQIRETLYREKRPAPVVFDINR